MTAHPTRASAGLLLLVALLCARACHPLPAYAADPDPVGLPRGSTCMRLGGMPLPCHGVLLSPLRARELRTAEVDRDEVRALLAAERERAAVDAAAAAELLAESERLRRACELTRAPLPRAVPWYERPGWVLAGGVVLGAAAAVLVVEAVR